MTRRRSGRGVSIEIEGLDEMLKGLARGERELKPLLREVLKGAGGEALVREAKQRTPTDTGTVRRAIGIETEANGLVYVGVRSQEHPTKARGGRASKYSGIRTDHIGVYLEDGVRPHEIKRGRYAPLTVNGRAFVSRVEHPGFRGRKIMSKSLRAAQPAFESALFDVVDEMVRRRMDTDGALS